MAAGAGTVRGRNVIVEPPGVETFWKRFDRSVRWDYSSWRPGRASQLPKSWPRVMATIPLPKVLTRSELDVPGPGLTL